MATVPKMSETKNYPTSDGRPIAETDRHRDLMMDLIQTLQGRYENEPNVYVSGNLLLYYEEGNKRRHVSPDVFVVQGVPKRERLNYLLWEEGKGPDVVIELTSSSTRREDVKKKFELYQDVLHVAEYFLFDPYGDYLRPSFQGYRLQDGKYQAIEEREGKLVSTILGLELKRHGDSLRLFDPVTGEMVPTRAEELHRLRAELEAIKKKTRARS